MPNRILKETICTSCEIDSLSMGAENLFYRLIVQCDDFGRMDARLPIIRAKCYPLKISKVRESDVKKWLQEIIDIGLIQIYTVEGKPYLQMVTWDKHQQKRAKHSKYPAPDDGLISDDINCNQVQSNVPENREYENTRIENTRSVKNEKIKLSEYVSMTEEQHQKLIDEHGERATKAMITILDNYKGAKGKQYKCDYRAILNWVVKRYTDEHPPGAEKPPGRRTVVEHISDDGVVTLKEVEDG